MQRCDADHLALHVDDGTAARAGRNRRGDLNDATKAGNVAHRGNNSVRHAAFQAERIADDDDAFAFLRRRAFERKRAHQTGRRFDLQQRDVRFGINREHVLHGKVASGSEMNFGAICAVDYVTVRDDPILVDEKAATACKFLAPRVEGFDCYCGRFDPTDEIREFILGAHF